MDFYAKRVLTNTTDLRLNSVYFTVSARIRICIKLHTLLITYAYWNRIFFTKEKRQNNKSSEKTGSYSPFSNMWPINSQVLVHSRFLNPLSYHNFLFLLVISQERKQSKRAHSARACVCVCVCVQKTYVLFHPVHPVSVSTASLSSHYARFTLLRPRSSKAYYVGKCSFIARDLRCSSPYPRNKILVSARHHDAYRDGM